MVTGVVSNQWLDLGVSTVYEVEGRNLSIWVCSAILPPTLLNLLTKKQLVHPESSTISSSHLPRGPNRSQGRTAKKLGDSQPPHLGPPACLPGVIFHTSTSSLSL